MILLRSKKQVVLDTITFPFRALTLFDNDRWGLSSLRTERFDYVAREVIGYTLDVGCGRKNLFIRKHLGGEGKGIDVFSYEGLEPCEIVKDITHFPFADRSFQSVTFIANLNHIPESIRDQELSEAYRVLKPAGNIIITMGNPFVEVLVHKLVDFYHRVFHTRIDMDHERGMHEEESYYLNKREIMQRLTRAGFSSIRRKRFASQWGLNSLYVGWKSH